MASPLDKVKDIINLKAENEELKRENLRLDDENYNLKIEIKNLQKELNRANKDNLEMSVYNQRNNDLLKTIDKQKAIIEELNEKFKDHHPNLKPNTKHITANKVFQVIELLDDKFTYREIQKKLNVSLRTISRIDRKSVV